MIMGRWYPFLCCPPSLSGVSGAFTARRIPRTVYGVLSARWFRSTVTGNPITLDRSEPKSWPLLLCGKGVMKETYSGEATAPIGLRKTTDEGQHSGDDWPLISLDFFTITGEGHDDTRQKCGHSAFLPLLNPCVHSPGPSSVPPQQM